MKAPVSLVMLALALGALGATLPDGASAPATTTVTLGLVDDTLITVNPDPVTVNRGDTLVFRADPSSGIERFNIRLMSPAPFGPDAAVGGFNGRRGRATRGTVRASARVGERYKYVIRVWNGRRPIELDPEIVIGPSE